MAKVYQGSTVYEFQDSDGSFRDIIDANNRNLCLPNPIPLWRMTFVGNPQAYAAPNSLSANPVVSNNNTKLTLKWALPADSTIHPAIDVTVDVNVAGPVVELSLSATAQNPFRL